MYLVTHWIDFIELHNSTLIWASKISKGADYRERSIGYQYHGFGWWHFAHPVLVIVDDIWDILHR